MSYLKEMLWARHRMFRQPQYMSREEFIKMKQVFGEEIYELKGVNHEKEETGTKENKKKSEKENNQEEESDEYKEFIKKGIIRCGDS